MGFTDIQNEFMRHIRDPENCAPPANIEDRRLNVYRELFFNNVRGFLSSGFPVIESILTEEQWQTLARRFFAEHHCRSPYFVDISKEFVEYLGNEATPEQYYFAFLPELAHYEWLELEVGVRKSVPLSYWDEKNQYTAFGFSPLAELVSYHWPVHQISPTFLPQTAAVEPLFFMVFRNNANEVTFSQINQVTAHLINVVSQQDTCDMQNLQGQMMQALPQLPENQVRTATTEIVEQMLAQQIFVLV